jgi:hypothetical protein
MVASPAPGAEPGTSEARSSLLALAFSKFPNPTRCERSMLEYSDIANTNRGEFAICGSSADPADPSNDPKDAAEWSPGRNLSAALVRWLETSPAAIQLEDPGGIRLLGANMVGQLNLEDLKIPFAIVMRKSHIQERLRLAGTELPLLDLGGSYVSELEGTGLIVHRDLILADGFRASGESLLVHARIGGILDCHGGHFSHSRAGMEFWEDPGENVALNAWGVEVTGDVLLNFGFESDGEVNLVESIAKNLMCFGGRFMNPGKAAIDARSCRIDGVELGQPGRDGTFEADGLVNFAGANLGVLWVQNARFLGTASQQHGLLALGVKANGLLMLDPISFEHGAILNLAGAKLGPIVDSQKSWPEPGRLLIDGLSYDGLAESRDAPSRLRWLALQPGFFPQTYRQLANVLAESGDDTGATQVRIAAEDLRYSRYGLLWRIWGAFLKYTIGYGHRPMLTVMWSLAVMLLGWAVVSSAKATSVMRPTYPENTPPNEELHYQELHPLLYSLDVFLPFVNLHQEHYWWPDGDASGNCVIFGRSVSVRGSLVEYYLWAQIIAGWILSAIFVAGVTGIIRND